MNWDHLDIGRPFYYGSETDSNILSMGPYNLNRTSLTVQRVGCLLRNVKQMTVAVEGTLANAEVEMVNKRGD